MMVSLNDFLPILSPYNQNVSILKAGGLNYFEKHCALSLIFMDFIFILLQEAVNFFWCILSKSPTILGEAMTQFSLLKLPIWVSGIKK